MSKAPELKPDEIQSLKNIEALEKHLARKSEMLTEYREYDERAVELAHRVVAEAYAASPYANASNYELYVLRQKRDDASWRWNRTRDIRESACQKLTLPVILRFHEKTMERVRWLGTQRNTEFVTGLGEMQIDKRRVRVKTNFVAIGKAQEKLFKDLKEVQGLQLSPLSEVRARIKQADADFELVALQMEESEMFESQYRGLQELERLPALPEREVVTRDMGVLPAK